MASRWVAALAAAVVGVTLAGCAPAPAPAREPARESATTRRLTGYLENLVGAQRFRGAVEVRLGDQVLLRRGFDKARDGEPAGPDTRYVIASMTKQFTALAVLLLQDRGKLAVTDPVCEYLPDCPPAWRAITIDQLLTHTSGLFDYLDVEPAAAARLFARLGTGEPSPEQLTSLFANRPLEFGPGTRWKYSNSGYVLLGRVIEKVAGQDYGQFMRTAILDPLRMTNTGYRPGAAGLATGYDSWTDIAGTHDTSAYYAAAGIYSTARNMARWNDFLLTGSPAIADQDTLAELLRPRVEVNALEQYGYGIQIREAGGRAVYFHDGGVPGFASYNEVQPGTGVSVVVLSNLGIADAEHIGRTLASMAVQ
ncbi:MAG TPA: serine hydrolase domain-containing protein [Actinophytocola sp.]|jgi:CubicO group peptidase (beta-lactamase class C family)|nr:serine hydrolase domain-containing protein [Actinophytocola sp.]